MNPSVRYRKRYAESSTIPDPSLVMPDNSDLYRYDAELAAALHKERFNKARPDLMQRYCDAAGLTGAIDPYESFDMQLDLERFVKTLDHPLDRVIFQSFLLGRVRQTEIAELAQCCQATVSNRLRKLTERFAQFYLDEDDYDRFTRRSRSGRTGRVRAAGSRNPHTTAEMVH